MARDLDISTQLKVKYEEIITAIYEFGSVKRLVLLYIAKYKAPLKLESWSLDQDRCSSDKPTKNPTWRPDLSLTT